MPQLSVKVIKLYIWLEPESLPKDSEDVKF